MKMNFDIHKAEDVAAVMNEIYSMYQPGTCVCFYRAVVVADTITQLHYLAVVASYREETSPHKCTLY